MWNNIHRILHTQHFSDPPFYLIFPFPFPFVHNIAIPNFTIRRPQITQVKSPTAQRTRLRNPNQTIVDTTDTLPFLNLSYSRKFVIADPCFSQTIQTKDTHIRLLVEEEKMITIRRERRRKKYLIRSCRILRVYVCTSVVRRYRK